MNTTKQGVPNKQNSGQSIGRFQPRTPATSKQHTRAHGTTVRYTHTMASKQKDTHQHPREPTVHGTMKPYARCTMHADQNRSEARVRLLITDKHTHKHMKNHTDDDIIRRQTQEYVDTIERNIHGVKSKWNEDQQTKQKTRTGPPFPPKLHL
jgi:hypothetical protein